MGPRDGARSMGPRDGARSMRSTEEAPLDTSSSKRTREPNSSVSASDTRGVFARGGGSASVGGLSPVFTGRMYEIIVFDEPSFGSPSRVGRLFFLTTVRSGVSVVDVPVRWAFSGATGGEDDSGTAVGAGDEDVTSPRPREGGRGLGEGGSC
jgi:hypothetical protein